MLKTSYNMTSREQCHTTRGKCPQGEDIANNAHFRGYFWNNDHIESRFPFFVPSESRGDVRGANRSTLGINYATLHNFFVPGEAEVAPGLFFLHDSLLYQFTDDFLLEHLICE